MKKTVLLLSSLAVFATAAAQTAPQKLNNSDNQTSNTLSQKVRGRVVDAESKQPIPGAVVVLLSNSSIAAISDADGYFVLENVPLGRQSFQFSFMGFEPYTAYEVPVISGKELELNVAMQESLTKLKEVTVTAGRERTKPFNEFATISARSFSVEETRRYAASFSDPARMVMNFPGVSNAGDLDNSIVVRGNSPKGVLWRMEGIEIPNPNHFGSLGASGGPISMLNANTLGTSDFYTGAFAPEIGNALSGAFDLNLRNGNTERYEHTVQIGTLGMEVATEGPLQKGKKASYLLNYRYSTLALLKDFMPLGQQVPEYQDAALKINLPTEKAGTFSLFALGGYNQSNQKPEADSSKWDNDNPNLGFDYRGKMGVAGVSHQYALGKDAYIKTVVSASYDNLAQDADTLNPSDSYNKVPIENNSFTNMAYRGAISYNKKLNARNTFRTGVVGQQLSYDFAYNYYDGEKKVWKNVLKGDGNTQYYQAFVQWKSKLTERLTLVGGLHVAYLALNEKYAIEPRASLSYQAGRSRYTLAGGLHSKPEHLSTYLFQDGTQGQAMTYPNKDLDLLRAMHAVAGYETALPWKVRMKIEAYYQHLYNIPVEQDTASGFSIINALDVYSLIGTKPLVSEGTGRNYGVDISFERPFSDGYYIIATGSLFNSTYTNYKGDEYNTRFNRGHQVNVIGGKEFKVTSSGRKVLGLNGKVLYAGGTRESQIDLAKSIANKTTEIVPGKYFTEKAPAYFRADASVYYKINNRRATHSIQLEIQNLTNRENYYFSYFDSKAGEIKRVNQLGILPNLSYRVDFHW